MLRVRELLSRFPARSTAVTCHSRLSYLPREPRFTPALMRQPPGTFSQAMSSALTSDPPEDDALIRVRVMAPPPGRLRSSASSVNAESASVTVASKVKGPGGNAASSRGETSSMVGPMLSIWTRRVKMP